MTRTRECTPPIRISNCGNYCAPSCPWLCVNQWDHKSCLLFHEVLDLGRADSKSPYYRCSKCFDVVNRAGGAK